MTAPAVLSIGSNLGDRLAHLRLAVELLAPVARSGVWETAPVGGPEQDDYLNAVLLCDLDATQAWERAQAAERGREEAMRELVTVRAEAEALQERERTTREAMDALRGELAGIKGRGGWRGVLLRLAGAG